MVMKLYCVNLELHFLSAVNILLRNEKNSVQVDYSNFSVDTLTEICSLFDKPMTVVQKELPKGD